MRVKRGLRRDAGDLPQFGGNGGDNRAVRFVQHAGVFHAAQEAARHYCALRARGARTWCPPRCRPPGGGAPFAAPENRNRTGGGRNRPRRSPEPRSSTSCRPTVPSNSARRRPPRPAAPKRCALRKPPPGVRSSANRRRCLTRNPAPVRSIACAAHCRISSCPPMEAIDGVHHLPQPALQRAEQRGGAAPIAPAALARSASTPRVRLPYRLASSTKRGSTLLTLRAPGSPP